MGYYHYIPCQGILSSVFRTVSEEIFCGVTEENLISIFIEIMNFLSNYGNFPIKIGKNVRKRPLPSKRPIRFLFHLFSNFSFPTPHSGHFQSPGSSSKGTSPSYSYPQTVQT